MDPVKGYLEAFRRQYPGPDAQRRNWEAIQNRAAEPSALKAVGTTRYALRRTTLVVGLTLACAAAVVLMLRGLTVGVRAMSERLRSTASEAVDQPTSRRPRQVTVGRAGGPAPRDRAQPPPMEVVTEAKPRSAAEIRRQPAPKPDPASTATASPETLAAEARLIGQARQALAAGELASALNALEQHARQFPTGALAEERLAYMAIWECRSRPTSSDAMERFIKQYPSSPHMPRVRRACGATPARPQ